MREMLVFKALSLLIPLRLLSSISLIKIAGFKNYANKQVHTHIIFGTEMIRKSKYPREHLYSLDILQLVKDLKPSSILLGVNDHDMYRLMDNRNHLNKSTSISKTTNFLYKSLEKIESLLKYIVKVFHKTLRTIYDVFTLIFDALDIVNQMINDQAKVRIERKSMKQRVISDISEIERKFETPYYSISSFNGHNSTFPLGVQEIVDEYINQNTTVKLDISTICKNQKEVDSLRTAVQNTNEVNLVYSCQQLHVDSIDQEREKNDEEISLVSDTIQSPNTTNENKLKLLEIVLDNIHEIHFIDEYCYKQKILKTHLPLIWDAIVIQNADYAAKRITSMFINSNTSKNRDDDKETYHKTNITTVSILPDILFPYVTSEIQKYIKTIENEHECEHKHEHYYSQMTFKELIHCFSNERYLQPTYLKSKHDKDSKILCKLNHSTLLFMDSNCSSDVLLEDDIKHSNKLNMISPTPTYVTITNISNVPEQSVLGIKSKIGQSVQILGSVLKSPVDGMVTKMEERFTSFMNPFLHYQQLMSNNDDIDNGNETISSIS